VPDEGEDHRLAVADVVDEEAEQDDGDGEGEQRRARKIAPFCASVSWKALPHSVISMARTMNAKLVANMEAKQARKRRLTRSAGGWLRW
jgi:hypothetical protein